MASKKPKLIPQLTAAQFLGDFPRRISLLRLCVRRRWLTDVLETFADNSELQHATGVAPRMSIEDGSRSFVTWYRAYRGKK